MPSQLRQQQNWVVTGSLSVLAVVALAFVLHYTRGVLIPFVVAIFVGSLISPVMDLLELRFKVRHSVSVVIAVLLVLVVTLAFVGMLLGSIRTVVDNAASYSGKFEELSDVISRRIDSILPGADADEKNKKHLARKKVQEKQGNEAGSDAEGPEDDAASGDSDATGNDADQTDQTDPRADNGQRDDNNSEDGGDSNDENSSDNAKGDDVKKDAGATETAMTRFVRSLAPQFASRLASSVLSILSGGTVTLIFVLFVLAGRQPHVIRKGVYAEIDSQVRSYIATKVALSASTGILVWIILRALSLEMAGVFGMLAFLLNFIPSVGSIIATLIPIPFALSRFPELFEPGLQFTPDTIEKIVWLSAVVILPGGVQMLIGNVLEPKLMGEGLQLHPITILLSLSVWALLWGPVGMLLAVPMTAIIRIVLMRFEITQPAAKILAGELPDLDTPQSHASGS